MSNDELEVNHHGRFDDTDEPFEAYVTSEGECYWRVDNQTFQLVNHQEGKKRRMKQAEFMARQALIALNKLTRANQNECSEALFDLECIENFINSYNNEDSFDVSRLPEKIETIRQALIRPSVDPVLIRALKSYRDEHCFEDSEYGIAIDKFLKQNHINTTTDNKPTKDIGGDII